MSIKFSLIDSAQRQFITETEGAKWYINSITRIADKKLMSSGLKALFCVPKNGDDNYYVLCDREGIKWNFDSSQDLLKAVYRLVERKFI